MTQVFSKKKHPLGFYQAWPLPSEDELERFYRDRYYQGGSECYQSAYVPEEIEYFRNRPRVAEAVWKRLHGGRTGRMIDVGCGEGFFAAHFLSAGWEVQAADFSSQGIRYHHPELLPFFEQGNLFKVLDGRIASGKTYDFINLTNVLEHVTDPLGLLQRLRRIMNPDALLQIAVPNDFSELQELLTGSGRTTETWFAPPQHLNYFTFESFRHVLEASRFTVEEMLADFPIEFYLFNEHSNYWLDRSKGKAAHRARVEIDNFLVRHDLEAYIGYMRAAARCGVGRNAIAVVRSS